MEEMAGRAGAFMWLGLLGLTRWGNTEMDRGSWESEDSMGKGKINTGEMGRTVR